ncbi:protein regulator of cytokinesis 1-like [Dendronephthya gigantea]|uniref:protein regulator of cytokinesis 1-like n=1 Tax=Dendronephthya gigantea TaxID=151771 RepID=UPI00106949BC|nr:protein regulator of cytokinesis 1-like [Dendronephthya gigantea]
MGISASAQQDRVDAVINYISELLSDMVNDEENLLNELVKNTERYREELAELGEILGFPQYKLKDNLSLIEKEKDLRTKLDAWNLEKEERSKKFKALRQKEDVLCKRLALPPHDTSIGEIPTSKEVKEIEANIKYMETQLAQARIHFQDAREKILRLWKELEIDEMTTKFAEISTENSQETYVLSKENLIQLKEHLVELEKRQESNHQHRMELMKKLKSLWMKLEINEKDQCAFEQNCVGFRPSAIQKLKDEVDKYECMKLKYTEKFILGLRKELKQLWDKCYFGEDERREFSPAFDDNYTEESLNIHEHQIRVLRGFYEDNKAIFKLVEKREMMWRKLMEFENKENDPARLFTNRGGALLKELKMKNAVEKGLPKVEEDLKKMIQVWQKENEGFFFVNGEKYLELIKTQQEERKRNKDLVKLGKQKEKKAAIKKEMVYGSKPIMPTKRVGKNSFRLPMNSKRKLDEKNGSASSSTISLTMSSSSTSSLMPSQNNTPASLQANVKTKKKTKNSRRISSKVKRHVLSSLKRGSKEDIDVDSSKDDDNDESISICTYPDFTNHIRRGRQKELSSTAATVESFESELSPTDQSL